MTRLRAHHACGEGLAWASAYATPVEAWAACHRADWMLWALDRSGYRDEATLRAFACWCARHTPLADGRTTWDLLTDPRSRAAVEVAERFVGGRATMGELAASWRAADDVTNDADAAYWGAPSPASAVAAHWRDDGGAAYAAASAAADAAYWGAPAPASAVAAHCLAAVAAHCRATVVATYAAAKAQAGALRAIVGNPFLVAAGGEAQAGGGQP